MIKCIVISFILFIYGIPASLAQEPPVYYNLIDEHENVVYITGWEVKLGDEILTEANKRYEVMSIAENKAYVRYLGAVDLSLYIDKKEFLPWTYFKPQFAEAQAPGKIAIYHTHSDESYVPTEGTESIFGEGGIYQVGSSFANALKAKGLQVIHSNAKHDPHDNMAYERSRRTVVNLLKEKPDAIFDLHRDSTPREVYQTSIGGKNVTKVQLVVGKYGPTGKQIEDYALQIKALADKQHPGLVKGIFFAKGGDYNQDLMPRSMLLEVGSHTNDRQSAEQGIALFADVVPAIIGGTSARQENQAGVTGIGNENVGLSGSMKSILWILGVFLVGVIAFLFLSTGSVKEAQKKVKNFFTTEFANFLMAKKKSGDKNKK